MGVADPIISGGISILAQGFASSTATDVIFGNRFVFAMTTPGPTTDAARAEAADAVQAFYNDWAADMSKVVGQIRFKSYDMGETPPRTPIEEGALTTVSSAASLPSELAACLSYYNGLVPRPRKRGRIFCGPLKQSTVDNTAVIPRLSTGFRTSLTGAAVTNLTGLATTTWGLLSPTDGVILAVEHGFVDDAYDVQRRRGEDPTTKLEFST